MQTVTVEGVEFGVEGRRFSDEGASSRALKRIRDKIRKSDDVGVYRVEAIRASAGRELGDRLIAIVAPPARVLRLVERVAIGGEPAQFTEGELQRFAMRNLHTRHETRNAPR